MLFKHFWHLHRLWFAGWGCLVSSSASCTPICTPSFRILCRWKASVRSKAEVLATLMARWPCRSLYISQTSLHYVLNTQLSIVHMMLQAASCSCFISSCSSCCSFFTPNSSDKILPKTSGFHERTGKELMQFLLFFLHSQFLWQSLTKNHWFSWKNW